MRVQKKTPKKALIITLSALLVVVAGATTYAIISQGNDSSEKADTSQSASKTDDTTNTATSSSSEEPTSSSTGHESQKNIQPSYEGEDANTSEVLTGVINYKAVVGSNLSLRTTINQTLSSGTCKLTLSNGSKVVTKSSAIMQNPSSSTCEGFDIPISELGSGTWSLEVVVTSGDRTGTLKDSVTI